MEMNKVSRIFASSKNMETDYKWQYFFCGIPRSYERLKSLPSGTIGHPGRVKSGFTGTIRPRYFSEIREKNLNQPNNIDFRRKAALKKVRIMTQL